MKGYDNEVIEIPKVYSDSVNDDIAGIQTTLGGLKIRKIQNGSKNIIQLETRPVEYAKVQKLYAYLKSRMWQKETIYIDSLKKEIIAYVEVKKIERNNSGDRNLYSLSIEVQEASVTRNLTLELVLRSRVWVSSIDLLVKLKKSAD